MRKVVNEVENAKSLLSSTPLSDDLYPSSSSPLLPTPKKASLSSTLSIPQTDQSFIETRFVLRQVDGCQSEEVDFFFPLANLKA